AKVSALSPCQLLCQIAVLPDRDICEPKPIRHRAQFGGQCLGHPRPVLSGFRERADDVQRIPGAFGLQIDATNKLSVEQERPYVVTELALRRWYVDFDTVVKVEEPLHSWPEEDQRVERAQQRGT